MSTITTSFFKRLRSLAPLDPERDWIVMFLVSIIALSGIIVWNAWAFDTVANGGTIGTPVATTTPVFNQSSLETIRTIFDSRAAEEAKYASKLYQYVDPSQ